MFLTSSQVTAIVEKAVTALGIDDDCRDKHMYYMIAVKIDDVWCLKPGITKVGISKRISQYVCREHTKQNFDMSTFHIIALFEYSDVNVSKHMESLHKSILVKYPLMVGQHGNTEQYSLTGVDSIIGNIIISCKLFACNSWICTNWRAKTLNKEIPRANADDVRRAHGISWGETMKTHGDKVVAPMKEQSQTRVKRQRDTSVPAYIQRLDDLYTRNVTVSRFNTTANLKSYIAFKTIYKTNSFDTSSKDALCRDIKAKMMAYPGKVNYTPAITSIMNA